MNTRSLSTGNRSYNISASEVRRRGKKKTAKARIRFVLLTITAVLFFSLGMLFASFRSNATPEYETEKVYTSITVEEGDSLWNIASENSGVEYEDLRKYIKEVKKLNHLSSEDIHAGEHLIIPVYQKVN